MKLQIFLALTAALPALASPIASQAEGRDVADVATVLIGVAEDKRDVADVATVLIGVADKRDAIPDEYPTRHVERDEATIADVATVLIGVTDKRDATAVDKREDSSVADVATVLIGVADRKKRDPAVAGAYAKFVEEAEAHPEDILG